MNDKNPAGNKPFRSTRTGAKPLDDHPTQGASSRKRPTQSDSPPIAVKGPGRTPRRRVGPEDEDRRVLPGEAGANDD
jgi:hypothetical protein